jgi:hypothetical protein
LTTATTIDEAYRVCSVGFHLAERRPRIDASGETVAQSQETVLDPENETVALPLESADGAGAGHEGDTQEA